MELAKIDRVCDNEDGKIWPNLKGQSKTFECHFPFRQLLYKNKDKSLVSKLKRKETATWYFTFCFPDAPHWQQSAPGCSCDFWQQLKVRNMRRGERKPAQTQAQAEETWAGTGIQLHRFPSPKLSPRPIMIISPVSSALLSFLQLHFSWPGIGRAGNPLTAADYPPQLKVDNNLNVYWLLQPSSRSFKESKCPFQWCIETGSSIKLKETFKPNGTKYVWAVIRADPFSRWAPHSRLDRACMTDHNGWRSWSNINFGFIFKPVNSDFDEISSGSKWRTWLSGRPQRIRAHRILIWHQERVPHSVRS